jgi:hypothetical protein
MTGRLIWNTDAKQISAGVQKIDYPAGKDLGNAMYLLRVQTEEGVETFKILCL